MDEQAVQEIVDEVLSSLEPLDTQSAALLQFLKAKGIASDEELAPYLEQAGRASNVRWLAARVRIKSLISSAMKTADAKADQTTREETKSKKAESAGEKPKPQTETARPRDSAKNKQRTNQEKQSGGNSRAEGSAAIAEKGENRTKGDQSDGVTKEQAA